MATCQAVNDQGHACALDAGHFTDHESEPHPIVGWAGDSKPLVMRSHWPLETKPRRTRRTN